MGVNNRVGADGMTSSQRQRVLSALIDKTPEQSNSAPNPVTQDGWVVHKPGRVKGTGRYNGNPDCLRLMRTTLYTAAEINCPQCLGIPPEPDDRPYETCSTCGGQFKRNKAGALKLHRIEGRPCPGDVQKKPLPVVGPEYDEAQHAFNATAEETRVDVRADDNE